MKEKILLLLKGLLDKLPFNGSKFKIAAAAALLAFLKVLFPAFPWPDSIDPNWLAAIGSSGALLALFHKWLKGKFPEFVPSDEGNWPTEK